MQLDTVYIITINIVILLHARLCIKCCTYSVLFDIHRSVNCYGIVQDQGG